MCVHLCGGTLPSPVFRVCVVHSLPLPFLFQASPFPQETTTLKLAASEPTQRPPGTVESAAAGNGATQEHRAGLDVEGAALAATSTCYLDRRTRKA